MFTNKVNKQNRLMIGTPVTGLVRVEWVRARYNQVIPCNWSFSEPDVRLNESMPLGFAVAEGRNLVVDDALKHKFEWLLFIDHDVILPPDCFLKMNEYMREAKYPVVCGLYYAKAQPPEPLLYRGRGNSFVQGFKPGDKVWVDGIPMGCTLIHMKVMELMARDAEWYDVSPGRRVKKIFDTPFGQRTDPEQMKHETYGGTEDLAWCNRVIEGDYLKKAGWPEIQRKKYPFLVDTSMFCRHITQDGQAYPIGV